MRYCCDKFEEASKRSNESSPNIRVVKYVSGFLKEEMQLNIKNNKCYNFNNLTFYITVGYSGNFKIDLPAMNIEYCPFCGAKLSEIYMKDEYANEIEGVTFPKLLIR